MSSCCHCRHLGTGSHQAADAGGQRTLSYAKTITNRETRTYLERFCARERPRRLAVQKRRSLARPFANAGRATLGECLCALIRRPQLKGVRAPSSTETTRRRCDRVGGEPVAVRSPARCLCRTRQRRAHLANIWLVPLIVEGRQAGHDYRELTKVENKRFEDRVNVFFSTRT
jgi:hypothetical protein